MYIRSIQVNHITKASLSGNSGPLSLRNDCVICCFDGAVNIESECASVQLSKGSACYLSSAVKNEITGGPANVYIAEIKVNYIDFVSFLSGKLLLLPSTNSFFTLIDQAVKTGQYDMVEDAVFDLILPFINPVSGSFSPSTNIQYAIQEFIESHLIDGFSVEELAFEVGMSSRKLNDYLSATCQCTAIDYINRYKLKKAKNYLAYSSLSITEISALCGFKSVHYFSRQFKNEFGCSPITFRESEQNKKQEI